MAIQTNIHNVNKSNSNISKLKKDFEETISREEIGFFDLPKASYQKAVALYEVFESKKEFVLFGIGGSALGPKMLESALGDRKRKFHFLENIDADTFAEFVETVDAQNAIYYIVSKSGGTAETLALLCAFENEMNKRGVDVSKLRESYVIATEPKDSGLTQFAKDNHVKTLEIPFDVGGRFSVLTNVGLFPAMFMGIDVKELLSGAGSFQIEDNLETACIIHELYESGVNHSALMPYSHKMKYFSDWFVQLWAESLGKDGQGLTPISAIGATDQHSILQLFTAGPADKFYFLLEVEKRSHDFHLGNSTPHASFEKLSKISLNTLYKAEFEGTFKSLLEVNRPVVHMKIDELNAFNLGYLIMYFESLTVLMGSLMQINPFDQPGVEASKKFAWEWVNSNA
jgi:glucose-6-phosphate isomerase